MAPKGNKKGRPPADWLSLAGVRKKQVTIAEIVAASDMARATVSGILTRLKVPWTAVEKNGRLTKVYRTEDIRAAYEKAWLEYYGD